MENTDIRILLDDEKIIVLKKRKARINAIIKNVALIRREIYVGRTKRNGFVPLHSFILLAKGERMDLTVELASINRLLANYKKARKSRSAPSTPQLRHTARFDSSGKVIAGRE